MYPSPLPPPLSSHLPDSFALPVFHVSVVLCVHYIINSVIYNCIVRGNDQNFVLRYLIERYTGILFSSDLFIVCPLLLYVHFLMKNLLQRRELFFFCNNSVFDVRRLSKDKLFSKYFRAFN